MPKPKKVAAFQPLQPNNAAPAQAPMITERQPTSDLKIIYAEPGVRELIDWEPPMVRAAMRELFMGQYQLAGALADSIMGDLRTASVLGVRVRGLDSLDVTISHPRQDVIDALKIDLDLMYPDDTAFELRTSGWLGGACLAQINWDTSGDRWIPRIEPWHLSLQRYDPMKKQWYAQTATGEIPVSPGDGKWVLFAPGGRRRPWRQAMVRGLGLLHVIKRYDMSDWANYNEVHGKPIRVGTGAANKDEVRKLAADLSAMGGDTSLGLTAGRDVKLIEAVSQSWRSFKEQLSWVDTEIAIGILGQNLTTEVVGGSLAAAKVHEKVRQDIIEADMGYERLFLVQQVLPYWMAFNYGQSSPSDVPDVQRMMPTGEQPPIEQWHAEKGLVTPNEVREGLGLPEREAKEGADDLIAPVPDAPPNLALAASRRLDGLVSLSGTLHASRTAQQQVDVLSAGGAQGAAPELVSLAAQAADLMGQGHSASDVQAALVALYRQSDPTELQTLLERAFILAELIGMDAVQQEVTSGTP